jgi:hypothetical protein
VPRFFPSHRNPEELQTEVCDFCGNLRPRNRLVVLQFEGMRGRVACDLCLGGDLKGPSFRDYRALRGRTTQRLPERLPPYGAAEWFAREAEE